MIGNFLVLLLIIGLAILFGWLAYRAVRGKKLVVKIVGGLLAGLLTIVLTLVAFMGAKGLVAFYFPGPPSARDISVAGTPEQIARGEYLANISCVGCHSVLDSEGVPNGEFPLAGGFNLPEAEGFGFIGDMVAENLTPGGKLAGYSDGEIFRALRYGVDKDGHLLALMSFLPYNQLSDDDTEAIIAFLRSQPVVETTVETGDRLNFIGAFMFGAGLFGEGGQETVETIEAPPPGHNAAYGKYVATFGECRGCHGPDMIGSEATAVSEAVPNPRPLVISLSQDEFFEMMRSGIRPGNNPFPDAMPWQNAAKMNDDDLAALYSYLTTNP
jgi:mono/diheme cytochrome c family protein